MPVTIERPILRIGRWDASTGPFECTQAGIDHILAMFQNPDQDTPTIKLGHWSEFAESWDDGTPAIGWILGLKQVGDVVWASIALIESSLERLGINAAEIDLTYPRGSIEAHLKDIDNPDSLVLEAFSLLSESPAVKGIEYTAALDELAPPSEDGWTVRPAGVAIAARGRKGSFRVEVALSTTPAPKSGGRAKPPTKGHRMPEMSPAVLAELGLDETADDAAVLAAIKAKTVAPTETPKVDASTVAPGAVTVDGELLAQTIAQNAELEARLAALEAEKNVAAASAVVEAALQEGRIAAASKDVFIEMATNDIEAAKKALATMTPIIPVAARGTTAKPTVAALSSETRNNYIASFARRKGA